MNWLRQLYAFGRRPMVKRPARAAASWWMERIKPSETAPPDAAQRLYDSIYQHLVRSLTEYKDFSMYWGKDLPPGYDLMDCLKDAKLQRDMFAWPVHAAMRVGRSTTASMAT
jgi:hypothetical protein